MDNDIEDIKKLDAVIKNEHDHDNFRDEFDDFINNTISDDEEQVEGGDDEEFTEIEDAVNNIFDFAGQNKYHNVDKLNFSDDLNSVKNFLDLEEVKVINSCKDVKLKKLLILNRAKHVQLQSIRYRFYELLKECKVSIKSIEDELEQTKAEKKNSRKGIMPKLGHPYFKTKDFYSCAPNNDTVRKQNNGEICIDYLPQLSRWTAEDQVILKRAIIFNYTLEMIDKYESKLNKLETNKKKITNKEERAILENEISEVKKIIHIWKTNDKQDPPELNSNVEINWINISKSDLNDRHSPHACKAFWNIFLHPSINKEQWSEEENNLILEIAKKQNYENWEQIALEVNTNRSGFAICVHYYTTLSDRFKKDRFDPEEDEFLIDVVNFCRIGNYIPWSKVGYYFDNRSRAQLYHRYRYNLEYANMKKGPFSQAEDVLIALLVNKFGKDFTRCCKYIPNRSPTQIGHRYNNYLVFDNMNLGCWSLNEDQILLDHVKTHGEKNWSKLFSVLTMRNRTHLRQRYLYLKKWLTKNEGKDLTDFPRRTKRRNGMNSKLLELVKTCVEHFASSAEIPTLYEIDERLKEMGQRPTIYRPIEIRIKNDNVDKELMQFFQSTCKIRSSRAVSPRDVNHIVNVVKTLMTMLNVELAIPNNNILHSHPLLDALDTEILSELFKDAYSQDNALIVEAKTKEEPIASSSKLLPSCLNNFQLGKMKFNEQETISYVPPNINTLVGMRGMLLMHQAYKHKRSVSNQIRKLIGSEVISAKSVVIDTDADSQNLIDSDLKTFMNRITAIFKWPALMSVVEPNQNLIFNNCVSKPPLKSKGAGKVGRPKKNLIKIELMNKARLNKQMNEKAAATISISIQEGNPQDRNISKNMPNENETIVGSSSSHVNDIEFVHIKEEVSTIQMQKSNSSKRYVDSTNDNRQEKRIKTECQDNFEIMQLQEDINKLDNILLSELNDINNSY